MKPSRTVSVVGLVVAFTAVCSAGLAGQSPELRALDHDVYDSWNSVQGQELSDDGRWLSYAVVPQEGDAVLHVRSVDGNAHHVVPRGHSAKFSGDGGFVVFLIKPELALEREAKLEEVSDDEQPKDSLGVLDLASGTVERVARVKSFAVSPDAGAFLLYHLEKETSQADSADTEAAVEPETPEAPEQTEDEDESERKDKKDGTTLVLRDLRSGTEHRFAFAAAYVIADSGRHAAFVTSTADGTGDGAYVVVTASGSVTPLLEGEGDYRGIAFDPPGRQVAFLANVADYEADQPAFALYHWRSGDETTMVASTSSDGLPDSWWVSEHGAVSFSESGRRLFFGSAPRPEPEPEEETPEWEAVKVDVWNWMDPLLQPMQLVQRDADLKQSYRAVVHLRTGRIVQLADEQVPSITVLEDGDGARGFGTTDMPYRAMISWDWPQYSDAYVVDVETGARRKVVEKLQGSAEISPGGTYVYWWDGRERAWYVLPADGGTPRNVSAAIPERVDDELHDWPMIPSSYGDAGWTDGDRALLLYDRYDIWSVDPRGRAQPRNITEGFGRERGLTFRYVDLDRDEPHIDPKAPLLLRTFDRATKADGFFRDQVDGEGEPVELVMQDRWFGFSIAKAEAADVLLFTRSSFREFPDLWVSDLSLDGMRRLSDANPQLAGYRWGNAELVTWRSTDGSPVEGMLFTPDDFDPARQYPMMVYFYEKSSDGLHRFRSPGPGSSSISVSFYVSRGYVVFIPDIHYRVGYPGESALDYVVSGMLSILERGFVDPGRIGVQGHSWGGYQIAYLVTQTNIFAAAEAGAPVSNMTSAYGGIRWGSGMSRMFQYERSQSRIGGTLWEAQPRYIANSPLFWADKVETPLLMLHNDDDGAVPWYQGIEMFVALRRLGKPVWMLNYNGEPHGLRKYQNKEDWAIRMQQFFDHYLLDAPPPVWLAEGVPAVEKGRTLGLDLLQASDPDGSER